MTKVTIIPDNIEFIVNEDDNILVQALNNNLNIPYGCKNGKCGSCKCKLVSGEVRLLDIEEGILTPEEQQVGYTLLCKAYALTDIVLDIPNVLGGTFPIKTYPAKVVEITKSGDIALVKYKIPTFQKFNYYAGQYIDIIIDGKNRSYSIANQANETGIVEIHVKYHQGGLLSEFIWNKMQVNQLMRFKGPMGSFKLQESENPILFVATGTGFAPIKAILEELISKKSKRKIHFYWGNRFFNDFYLLELVEDFKQKLDIQVNLCLSQENHSLCYNGYVTSRIKNDFENLHNYEVYACGNMEMIKDVYSLVTRQLKLNKINFFSDAFTPSV